MMSRPALMGGIPVFDAIAEELAESPSRSTDEVFHAEH
jgi:hypothetical protein